MSDFRQAVKPHWSGVILTDSSLPDGTWHDILALAAALCPDAQVVVTALHADERMWAEVLNHGAFDLLAQPLDDGEVLRVVMSAWRQSQPAPRAAMA